MKLVVTILSDQSVICSVYTSYIVSVRQAWNLNRSVPSRPMQWKSGITEDVGGYFNKKSRQQLIHSSLSHVHIYELRAQQSLCVKEEARRHDSLTVTSSEKYRCPEDPSAQMCVWKHRTALDSLNLSSAAVSTVMTGESEALNRRRAARPSTQTPPDRVLAFADTLLR
ncbi:hypothetical protein DPX16_3378 [Anabarilius grahami]|uniref:Uncharacterized protein n=1 Tax=Anabarilius grahami TaxID=495550 RepID=A0A3N0XLE5_ANAGA|nr:hypothetical protein DPX16_3378 [Anabarilius grahami]